MPDKINQAAEKKPSEALLNKKDELAKAIEEEKRIYAMVRKLRLEVKYLEGLENIEEQANNVRTYRKLDYKVNEVILEDLCSKQTPIFGVKELFEKVLTIIDIDKPDKPVEIPLNSFEQFSARIRREGMKKIKEYCIVDDKNPRKLYIKQMIDISIRNYKRKDIRALNREELATQTELKMLENKAKIEKLKNGNSAT